jgi:hypothetical protein
MKNRLLTGAAIIGAILSTPAFAAETNDGIKLNLGGYFKAYMSYVNQDEAAGSGVNKVDILRTTEVHFDGKAKLENGLTVGAHIEGQADGGDDFFLDESYIFFSGDWGKVNLGRTYGTPYILQVVAPAANSNIDGRLQLLNPINLAAGGFTGALAASTYETDYDQDVSAKVDKLSYITPMLLKGLQFGLTYTPDGSGTSRGLTGNATSNDASQRSNIWEGAVLYENKDSKSFDYAIGAGYSNAQAEVTTPTFQNREAWNVGADFNIGKFGVGATYQVDDTGAPTGKMKYSVIGADYTEGKLVYGTSYYNKNDDVNNADINRYSAGITYKVIPGLSFRGSAHYYDISEGTRDFNATAILLGTDIKF